MSSSPYINHFLQPDTIIPSTASPQSWNRFSYVLNNPINAADPSGHKCIGELEECKENGKTINGAAPHAPKPRLIDPRLIKRYRGTNHQGGGWANEGYTNEGSIYATVPVSLDSEFHDAQLSTKAEESYMGWTGSGTVPYNFTAGLEDYVDGSAGLVSDFYNPPPGSYPINLNINWHGNAANITISSITVRNFSPTAVGIEAIQFRGSDMRPVIMTGPRDWAGMNGEFSMKVNTTVSMPTILDIQLTTVGGHAYGGANPPYISISLPAFPPNGSSSLH